MLRRDEKTRRSVKESVPQASEPSPSVAASDGAGYSSSASTFGFRIGGHVSPSMLLGLQATAGNGAVAQLVARHRHAAVSESASTPVLARDDAKAPSAPTPLRELVKGSPKIKDNPEAGAVSATPEGDQIHFSAPAISLSAEVKIDASKILDGEQIEVGFIQQVTKFDRTKLYQRPPRSIGSPPTIMRDSASGGGVRDVSKKKAPAPWYEPPSPATKGTGMITLSPTMWDQPDFRGPRKLREAKLIGSRGGDAFDVSLAIKRGAEIVHLDTFHWQISWDVDLAPDGSGKGGPLTRSDDGTVPTALSGITGNEALQASRFMAYDSVEDAKEGLRALGITEFIRQMPRAAAAEPESYWHMVTAIWHMNVGFVAEIEPFGLKDPRSFTVVAQGDRAASKEAELTRGKKEQLSFYLKEVVDPGSLSAPKPITVKIGPEETSVPWPWGDGQEQLTKTFKIQPRLSFGGE